MMRIGKGWRASRRLPIALVLLLAGCGMFGGSEDESAATPASAEDFPNLASVPSEAPPVTPPLDRQALVQGLMADRAAAEYTGELLNEAVANPPPAPPPPPAVAPPESTGGDADGEASSGDEEPAVAPLTPADVAALPNNLGDPVALIYFPADGAGLTDRDRAILRDVVQVQRRTRGARVRIIGHAAAAESAAFDIALQRAEAVTLALFDLGLAPGTAEMSTGGPTYDESNAAGAAANRRVAIYVGQ